jgi:hypothetical protein
MVATATLSGWGTLASGTCSRQNMSLAGAVSGDAIAEGWPATIPNNLSLKMRPGTDLVVVEVCNWSGSSIAIPDGLTFRGMVLRSAI